MILISRGLLLRKEAVLSDGNEGRMGIALLGTIDRIHFCLRVICLSAGQQNAIMMTIVFLLDQRMNKLDLSNKNQIVFPESESQLTSLRRK